MSEKLIIKNFGPIKRVELDIKKVNVLIGDQGTGKSTIAKILAIFKDDVFLKTTKELKKEFFSKYNLLSYFNKNTVIEYTSNNYSINFSKNIFTSTFSANLESLLKKYVSIYSNYLENPTEEIQTEIKDLNVLIRKETETFLFIPTERMYTLLISNTTLLNQTIDSISLIPKYLLDFSTRYIYEKQRANNNLIELFDVTYIMEEGQDYIITKLGKKIKLIEAASGLQSTIPLIILINSVSSGDFYRGLFIIEEPELNLYPETQFKLMNVLIEKCLRYKDDVLFTTHSPYILTSLNNLIQAYIVGSKKEKSAKVAEIVEKNFWLNPEDVSAYKLNNNGTAENIMDEETKLIKAETIDEVSTKINNIYDQLLRIDLGLDK